MSYSRECQPAYALASNEAKPDEFLLRNYSADAKYNDLYTCDHCDTILHVSCFLPARYLRSSKSLSICSYGGSGATECWCELCLQPTRTHSLPLLYPRSLSEMRKNPPVVCRQTTPCLFIDAGPKLRTMACWPRYDRSIYPSQDP